MKGWQGRFGHGCPVFWAWLPDEQAVLRAVQESGCHEGFVPCKQLKDLSVPRARGSRDVLQAGAPAAHTVLRQLGLHHFTSQHNEMAPVKPFAVGSPFP